MAKFELSTDTLWRGEVFPWVVTLLILLHIIVVIFWVFRVANEVSTQPPRPLAHLNKQKTG
jgi:F0F1-type ATP synthase assembly protein I